MTVVLAGVGADTTNLGVLGPLYDDGRFEYLPIPEKSRDTDERESLGSWELRYDDRTAAELASSITPRPVREPELTVEGTELAEWPVHHDPNFEALTYGEHRTSGYVSRLSGLEAGDVVGFYAGLRRPDGDRAHRYLIGYFTVASVAIVEPNASPAERRRILAAHPENAHAKRARGDRPFLEEKRIVIVDGREPGGLFERHPIRLSDYRVKPGNERPAYYLREAVATSWLVREGGENMTYKPAYRCAIEGEAFVDRIGRPGERSSASI